MEPESTHATLIVSCPVKFKLKVLCIHNKLKCFHDLTTILLLLNLNKHVGDRTRQRYSQHSFKELPVISGAAVDRYALVVSLNCDFVTSSNTSPVDVVGGEIVDVFNFGSQMRL